MRSFTASNSRPRLSAALAREWQPDDQPARRPFAHQRVQCHPHRSVGMHRQRFPRPRALGQFVADRDAEIAGAYIQAQPNAGSRLRAGADFRHARRNQSEDAYPLRPDAQPPASDLPAASRTK